MSTKILSALLGLSLFGCTETVQQVRPAGGDMQLHGWPTVCTPAQVEQANMNIESLKEQMHKAKVTRADALQFVQIIMGQAPHLRSCDEIKDARTSVTKAYDSVVDVERSLPLVVCATQYQAFSVVVHDRVNGEALQADKTVSDAHLECVKSKKVQQ